MRLAIVGHGRMGRAVEALAREQGHTIVTIIPGAENREGKAITRERLAGAEVAIEFTRPTTVMENLERLVAVGIPTVTGTTGWIEHLPRLKQAVAAHGGAVLYSPNFSVGVQLFLRAARELARRFAGHPEFDGFILEQHHIAKVDAPSGTALRLREQARAGDPSREFPISSIRAGATAGIHTLGFESAHETVRLEHTARSRHAFAAGALAAAEWLRGRRGVFTFEEMLFGSEP
jgi:4-hydroxy-tetrahydrodipicolinate reductase